VDDSLKADSFRTDTGSKAVENEGDSYEMASMTAVLMASAFNHNGKRRGSNPKTELPDDFDFAEPGIKDDRDSVYG